MDNIHMEVVVRKGRVFLFNCLKSLFKLTDIKGRDGHAQDGLHPGNFAQAFEGLDLPPPAAGDAADLIVYRLIAVQTDRQDKFFRLPLDDFTDSGNDDLGQIAVGREMQEQEIRAGGKDDLDDFQKILAQKNFSTGQIDPGKIRGLFEQEFDLSRREFILRGFPPDIAGLAAVIALGGQ